MESKYKFYIVIDGVDQAIEMLQEYAGEQQAKDFLVAMRDAKGLWIGLANGDMIALNEYLTNNVYFKAVKVQQ